MFRKFLMFCGSVLLIGCTGAKTDQAFAEFEQTYTPVYQRFTGLEIRAAQGKIWELGEGGKALQARYDALQKRHQDVNDLIVKANALAAEGRANKNPGAVGAGTQSLTEAGAQIDAISDELAKLNEALNALPAPEAAPEGEVAPPPQP